LLIEEQIIDEHVAGQFKLYRRQAFEEIGGFVEEVMWDGIDVHMSRMKGWETKSFYDKDAILYHHRLMGSSDKNVYKGRLRWGRGIWFMGYHPLMLGFRMFSYAGKAFCDRWFYSLLPDIWAPHYGLLRAITTPVSALTCKAGS
jgi:hypothetical protein